MRKVFEEWVIAQFGELARSMILDGFDENGYRSNTINTLWAGFRAGVELAPICPDSE